MKNKICKIKLRFVRNKTTRKEPVTVNSRISDSLKVKLTRLQKRRNCENVKIGNDKTSRGFSISELQDNKLSYISGLSNKTVFHKCQRRFAATVTATGPFTRRHMSWFWISFEKCSNCTLVF